MSPDQTAPVVRDRLVILSADDGLVVAGLVGAERILFGIDPTQPERIEPCSTSASAEHKGTLPAPRLPRRKTGSATRAARRTSSTPSTATGLSRSLVESRSLTRTTASRPTATPGSGSAQRGASGPAVSDTDQQKPSS